MTEWVDFEIWLDNVSVCGYMATDDQKLQWYGADGLEAYDDFDKTNFVGEVAHTEDDALYLLRWCLIQDFLSKVDIASELVKHQDEEVKITYGTTDDFARLELWINSSKLDVEDF